MVLLLSAPMSRQSVDRDGLFRIAHNCMADRSTNFSRSNHLDELRSMDSLSKVQVPFSWKKNKKTFTNLSDLLIFEKSEKKNKKKNRSFCCFGENTPTLYLWFPIDKQN